MNWFKLILLSLMVTNFVFLQCDLVQPKEKPPAATSLSQSFSGIWEGKRTSSVNSLDCVLCVQVVPECGPHEKLIQQTCTECAHCEPISGSRMDKKTSFSNFFKGFKKSEEAEIIELKLCVNNGKLEGTVNQDGDIDNAEIRSQSLISENKVFVVLLDKKGKTATLILELINEKKLLVTPSDANVLEATKTSSYKKCAGT